MAKKISCTHVPADRSVPTIVSAGCEDCLAAGSTDWVHLRFCQACGKVGCCDSSPKKHHSAHYTESRHPVGRSYEPGEHWWWCHADRELFSILASPPAPSYEDFSG